jgi:hypothetical protein
VSNFLTLGVSAGRKGSLKVEDNSGTQKEEMCKTQPHHLLSTAARFLACWNDLTALITCGSFSIKT